jgi:SWI/SNF-related matrix-associated actin-dependent regulator 1 of chromatin subfamily A
MAADTVIIFDQDFNPHNDRQAEDRAYRLGQTRDVRVFKLISKGTIEMEILQLATTKVQIDDSISATAPTPSTSANHTLPTYSNAQLPNTTATQSEKSIKKSLMNQFRKRVLSIQDPS